MNISEALNKLKKIITEVFGAQFIRFCMVGAVGVAFNYSVFFVLYRFLHVYYMIASGTGFVLAIFLAFYLNKRFTFKLHKKKQHVAMVKYFAVNITSMVIGLIVLRVLVEFVLLNVYLANALTLGVTATTNFLGSKYIAFK